MAILVGNYTALLSGYTWASHAATRALAVKQPAFITYSFPTRIPESVAEEYPRAASSWASFNATDRQLARSALKQWADASGIVALEVGADRGDILFNWLDFRRIRGYEDAAGFASYPFAWDDSGGRGVEYFLEDSGDVFLNAAIRRDYFATPADRTDTLLHEIGHALGFKHPFEPTEHNPRKLVARLDDTSQTVMSYTYPLTMDRISELGPLDLAAVRAVYGGPGSDGAHLASWRWSARAEVLTLTGRSGSDRIVGTSVTDRIQGAKGNDALYGSAGDDLLEGGAGHDRIYGGTGSDTLEGDAGKDTLRAGDGDDRLRPGEGGGSVDGGAGTDTLDLRPVSAAVTGDLDTGAFVIGASALAVRGIEIVQAGGGSDRLHGRGLADDRIAAGAGDDVLRGRGGDDVLDGGEGFDTVEFADAQGSVSVHLGLAGRQNTGEGSDTLISIEKLVGSVYDDTLTAGETSAALDGSWGDDTLAGGSGHDSLSGTWGNDSLLGGGGNDTLAGGWGDDVLTGGLGRDDLQGESGADRFVFASALDSAVGGERDVVAFAGAEGDRIDLAAIDADADATNGDQGFAWTNAASLDAAFTGARGQLRLASGVLQGDINGDGIADFEIQIVGALSAGDLVL